MLTAEKSSRRSPIPRAHRRARKRIRSSQFKTNIKRGSLGAVLRSPCKPRAKHTAVNEVALVSIYYTFGHDEISQSVTENGETQTLVFGHDGHGSVRILYDIAGAVARIAQAYTFSAYGEMLAVHGPDAIAVAITQRLSSLGYSGEHFDAKAQQQYLRARFYDPSNGRFNRLDPFAGNMQDPQSLHKYAYVHGDPIGMADPTGEFAMASAMAGSSIGGMLNQITADAGMFIAESFRKQELSWETAGWALAGAFLGVGMATTRGVVKVLGEETRALLDSPAGWRLRQQFATIGRLSSKLARQIQYHPSVQRAIMKANMFAEFGWDALGRAAHHLIPLEALKNYPKLMERAAKGGFNINASASGRLLRHSNFKYTDDLFDDGYRHFNNHPEYSQEVFERLEEIEDIMHELTDTEIAERIAELAEDFGTRIDDGTLIVK
jgi:RHS repeat-associated protein